jgi:hypothetical protein
MAAFRVHLLTSRLFTCGGNAEYLTEGSIRRDSGRVIYDVSESKTNMLHIMAGVVFEF